MKRGISFGLVLLLGVLTASVWLTQGVPSTSGAAPPKAKPATATATPVRTGTAIVTPTGSVIPWATSTVTRTPAGTVTGTATPWATSTPAGPPPANDEMGNAIALSGLPFTDARDTSGATGSVDDPYSSCFWYGYEQGTVWYKFEPSESLGVEANTFGSNYDTILTVYSNQYGYLSEKGCNDDSASPPQSQLRFTANAGQTYYFMVGTGGAGGNLVFNVNALDPPVNDDFDNAIEITTPLPFSDTRDVGGATWAADDRTDCYSDLGTVWYSFTPASDTWLEIDTSASSYYAYVSVYTGVRGALTLVQCGSYLSVNTLAGQTYYLMAGMYPGGIGSNLVLTINTFIPPANDDFDNAVAITTLPFSDTHEVSRATQAVDDPPLCNWGSGTVWYSFTAASDMRLEVDISESSYYGYVGVFTGSRGALTPYTYNCADPYNVLRFDALAGQTYYFMASMYTWGGDTNLVFKLDGLIPPANDDFDNAVAITTLPFSDTLETGGGTRAADDPYYCNYSSGTVWYSFTPASNNRLEVDTTESSYYAVVDVLTGSPGAFTGIICGGGSNSPLYFDALAGVTYYFMVGTYSGGAGGNLVFKLTAPVPPANDDFDNAVAITTLPFSDTPNIAAATRATDDPWTCYSSSDFGTVWYSFTPASDMRLEVDPTGGGYSAYVGVFTGSRGNLVSKDCASWSLRRFDVSAGITYYFMVSAYGSTPTFTIRVAPPPLAIQITPDSFATVNLQTGQVTLHGTVTCNQPSRIDIHGEVSQKKGRGMIYGPFAIYSLYCDGTAPVEWNSTVYSGPEGALFAGGKAVLTLTTVAYSERGDENVYASKVGIITLRGRR